MIRIFIVLIMSRVLRVQGLATIKGAVQAIEAFAKWLVEMLHKCPVELCDLLAVCTACNRGMIRERDKQILTRSVVAELLSALKFKCELAEENYLTIVRMVLQDFGEPLGDDWINTPTNSGGENEEVNENQNNRKFSSFSYWKNNSQQQQTDQFNTGAAEAIRPHVPELLEFISDMHVLAKLKKQSASNSDRVGGDLKAGLAEVVALEMSRPSVRDSRTVMRFIPWLYSPPSLAQALPGQFSESVANVRVLAWILLGSLHARGVNGFSSNFQQISQQQTNISQNICLPVPIACSSQMADYINFVLAGFADQSKQSVVHMSALFHAFHLCQLWTIYCEQTATSSRSEEMVAKTMQQLLDFWARVTPAILQLLSHSKVLADMVNLHFVNTLQALQQFNSAVLCQLYPMWEPVLTVHHAHVPRKLRLKFESVPLENAQMRSWLSKVRYKISQIELQTSASSPFYNV
uniref:Uncoordinated protein 79 n=3 Tax=Meloidogyne TaxID=189290 RepID=A0A914L757_MELIC